MSVTPGAVPHVRHGRAGHQRQARPARLPDVPEHVLAVVQAGRAGGSTDRQEAGVPENQIPPTACGSISGAASVALAQSSSSDLGRMPCCGLSLSENFGCETEWSDLMLRTRIFPKVVLTDYRIRQPARIYTRLSSFVWSQYGNALNYRSVMLCSVAA